MSRGLLADERYYLDEYRAARATWLGHRLTGMSEVTLRRYFRDAVDLRTRWTTCHEALGFQYGERAA